MAVLHFKRLGRDRKLRQRSCAWMLATPLLQRASTLARSCSLCWLNVTPTTQPSTPVHSLCSRAACGCLSLALFLLPRGQPALFPTHPQVWPVCRRSRLAHPLLLLHLSLPPASRSSPVPLPSSPHGHFPFCTTTGQSRPPVPGHLPPRSATSRQPPSAAHRCGRTGATASDRRPTCAAPARRLR